MWTARRQSGAVDPSAIAQVLSRRREDVEDPHLVQLVVTDEHAVAVPDGTRCKVDLALTEHHTCFVVGFTDAEVELAAHHDAQLLLVDVVMQERSGCPAI